MPGRVMSDLVVGVRCGIPGIYMRFADYGNHEDIFIS